MKTTFYHRIIVPSTIIAALIALPIFSTNPLIDTIGLSTAATILCTVPITTYPTTISTARKAATTVRYTTHIQQ
jgi:hypothetical protein